MAIDSNILANVGQPGAGYSPLAAIERVGVFQDKQQARSDAAAQREQAALIQRTLQEHANDPDAAVEALRGVNVGAAMALEKELLGKKKALIDMRTTEIGNDLKEAELFAKWIGDGSEAAWQNASVFAKESGNPEAVQIFSQPYNPQMAQQLRTGGLSEKDKLEAEQAALTRGHIEDWQRWYGVDEEEADAAMRQALGPKDYQAMKTDMMNAETSRLAEERQASAPPPATAGFTLSPGQTRYGPDGKPIASVAPTVAAGGAGAPTGLVQSILKNPQLFNTLPPTVKASVIVPLTDAGFDFGQSVVNDGKPSNGMEKRALNFFNRAQNASQELENIEDGIAKSGTAAQVWREWAPNMMQTTQGQQYTAAQRAFTEARLRKDSGAAIPESEFENDRRTYFVQAGDSEQTVTQKRRARAALLASLAFESGRALAEFYGDDASTMVDGFKKASQQPSNSEADAYTGEVRQASDGRLLGLVNGTPVELQKSGSGYRVKP